MHNTVIGVFKSFMAFYPELRNSNHLNSAAMVKRLNIFVCEEDHWVSDLLRGQIEPESSQVVLTASVAEGAALVECLNPDIIVLVLDMPDQDGLAACRLFRRCSDAPILVLSSNGRPNFAEQILDAGADDYLVKPINNNLIVASLNKLTRRVRAERENGKLHDDPTL